MAFDLQFERSIKKFNPDVQETCRIKAGIWGCSDLEIGIFIQDKMSLFCVKRFCDGQTETLPVSYLKEN